MVDSDILKRLNASDPCVKSFDISLDCDNTPELRQTLASNAHVVEASIRGQATAAGYSELAWSLPPNMKHLTLAIKPD